MPDAISLRGVEREPQRTLFARDVKRSVARVGRPSMLRVRPDIFFTQAAGSACLWYLVSVARSRSNAMNGTAQPQLVCTLSTSIRKIWRVPGSSVNFGATATQPASCGSTGRPRP